MLTSVHKIFGISNPMFADIKYFQKGIFIAPKIKLLRSDGNNPHALKIKTIAAEFSPVKASIFLIALNFFSVVYL